MPQARKQVPGLNITARFDFTVIEEIDRLASQLGWSRHAFFRRAVFEFVKNPPAPATLITTAASQG